MSFLVVPFSSNVDQAMSYSMPEAVSLGVSDNGGGGTIYLNGLGINDPTVSNAIDLKTLFVTTNSRPFFSYPLLNAFRRLTVNTPFAAQTQLVKGLHITIHPVATGGASSLPQIAYLATIPGADFVPFLAISNPAPLIAGTWRLDIRLRHSITS